MQKNYNSYGMDLSQVSTDTWLSLVYFFDHFICIHHVFAYFLLYKRIFLSFH